MNNGSMKRNENLPVHLYKLAGSVPVSFPLKPYQSQIEIVSKMLSAIKYAKNGVFESPTGTGKSLAILLGSISLQEQLCSENRIPNHSIPEVDHDSERPLSLPILPKRGLVFSSPIKPSTTMAAREVFQSSPIRNAKVLLTSDLDSDQTQPSKVWNQKVIISSRTQKQLIQLVKELREKTNFNPSMAMVASRYFYCIHPQRHTWDSKDEECIILKKGRPPTDEEIIAIPDVHKIHCPFEENSGLLAGQSRFRTELWDIEDLVEAGKQHQACPFYASKRLAKESKLIFAPYNYILDPRIRKACSLPLDNSVVVIDEAHNVEQVATDGVSVKLSKKDLLDAKADLKRVEVALLPETATQAGILGELISFFLAFCRRCEQVELTDFDEDTNRYWKVYDGQESLTMINRNFKTELALLHCAWSIINPAEPLMDCQGVNIDVLVGTKRVLENLLMILELLYQGNWAWCYKFVLEEVYEKVDGIDTKQFSFSWWCLSPKVVFKGIGESVHSLILTSGTLAPLKAFGPSLGISFEKTVECLHVINPHQILARKIVHSPSGFQLNGSFKNRETREYKDAIGESILEILRSTSQGALVFMPSYSMMHQMFIRWKETGLYKRLENVRTIFYEPRTSLDEIFMNSYYMSCFDPKPGLLFCIYRGKLSEGIDFANEQARTVICVGIPYPALFDPLVQEKKRCHPKGWYEIQAYRAINQALGRCIRHSKDWGGVYLLDSRISVEMLPKWFRGYLEYATDWSKLSKDIQDFFVLNQTVFCHSCGHGIEISKIVGCVNEMHQFCQSCYQKWFQKEEDNVLTMLQEGDVGLDCLVEDCPFKLSVDQVNELFQSFNLN